MSILPLLFAALATIVVADDPVIALPGVDDFKKAGDCIQTAVVSNKDDLIAATRDLIAKIRACPNGEKIAKKIEDFINEIDTTFNDVTGCIKNPGFTAVFTLSRASLRVVNWPNRAQAMSAECATLTIDPELAMIFIENIKPYMDSIVPRIQSIVSGTTSCLSELCSA